MSHITERIFRIHWKIFFTLLSQWDDSPQQIAWLNCQCKYYWGHLSFLLPYILMESKSLLVSAITSGNTNWQRSDCYKCNVDWWSTWISGSVAWKNVLNESNIGIADYTKKAYNLVHVSLNFLTNLKRKTKLLNLKTANEMLCATQKR